MSVRIDEIMDMDLLRAMLEGGFVRQAVHPDDESLRILTYSTLAQIQGRWNEVTKAARGLMVRTDADDFSGAVVVERPWKKFYTLSQMESGWSLGDEDDGVGSNDDLALLDFDAPAEVTDKRDGSMGILYVAPDGELAIATKGSFVSEPAVYYTKMLRNNDDMLAAAHVLKDTYPDVTFLFELTGANNQIVVSYDVDEISMIGAVEKSTGLYRSTADFVAIWGDFPVAEMMPARTLREALSLPNRQNREGVVVRQIAPTADRQMMVKIKQDDYLALHRLMTTMSPRRIFESTRDGVFEDQMKTIKDSSFFNEENFAKFRNLHEKFVKDFASREAEIRAEYDTIKHIEDRAEFAKAAKQVMNTPAMFAMKDNKNIAVLIWRAMEKNIPTMF